MNKKLHILFITSGLKTGGAERLLLRLLPALQNYGIEVFVICLTGEDVISKQLRDEGIRVHCLGIRWSNLFSSVFALRKIVREFAPDLVQTWLYHADLLGGLIARLTSNKPVIWGVRNSKLNSSSLSFGTRMVILLCRLVSRWIPTHVVACAYKAKEAHVRMGYPPELFTVIQNGVDITEFCPNPILTTQYHSDYGYSKNDIVIGYAGRFDSNKNHIGFLRALTNIKYLESIRILMCGTGVDSSNNQLSDKIHDFGLSGKVVLLGCLQDMPKFYRCIDLYVSSSISEGFPNTVAEAMSCGVPCVVTDVGDSTEIVGDAGVTVAVNDDHAMAKAIDECLQLMQTSFWQQRKIAARERIKAHFSVQRMAAAYAALYRKLAV